MLKLNAEILVAGGGPAGMSAAIAASERGCSVTIVDDNPHLGGQIWRSDLGKRSPKARDIIAAITSERISILNGSRVVAIEADGTAHILTPSGRASVHFRNLVIATGARELFLPFPGWTRPNVFGAAGLQALVKGGFDVRGQRVVVAGTGPLLPVVAAYLIEKGADVRAIVEQASLSALARFALKLLRRPSKLAEGLSLRSSLQGVPFFTGSWVTSAVGGDKLQTVEIQRRATTLSLACDILACGFHLVPNVELAALLGCKMERGFVVVDEFQRTSVSNVYAAGELTGIGGVDASLIEGRIAGLAAVGRGSEAERHFADRKRSSDFARLLDRTFKLHEELRSLAEDDTVVCRCEDVDYGRLKHVNNAREAKLQTRCGMGPCQGRVCGAATEFIFGWQSGSVRPPIFPVKLGEL